MIQSPAHAVNITVFLHQLHRVDLPEAVWRDILRQPESYGCTLDILPNRLPGLVFLGASPRKNLEFPGMVFEVTQQRLR